MIDVNTVDAKRLSTQIAAAITCCVLIILLIDYFKKKKREKDEKEVAQKEREEAQRIFDARLSRLKKRIFHHMDYLKQQKKRIRKMKKDSEYTRYVKKEEKIFNRSLREIFQLWKNIKTVVDSNDLSTDKIDEIDKKFQDILSKETKKKR